MKYIALGDLFTDEELRRAMALHKACHVDGTSFILKCMDEIVTPALPRINQKTKQENLARFWAYAIEHAITTHLAKVKSK